MTDVAQQSETVPSEMEVSSPVVWEAFILDADGFVISEHEDLDEILRLFPDEDEVDFRYGDVFPSEIVIVKGSASPQSAGSSRRMPGSHFVEDKIFEYDLELVEESETLVEIWCLTKAMAEGLNRFEATR